MKRLWAVIPVLFLGFVLTGYGDNSSADTTKKSISPPISGTEVLQNVYDDQQSTVYIKADRPGDDIDSARANYRANTRGDVALTDIMSKKKKWEQRFPAKRVVAMSVVTADNGYGLALVVGLLIHYEQR